MDMETWTNKQWGAVIGALLIVLVVWLGVGLTALVAVFGAVGYFLGKYLDGDLDIEDIRAQGRSRDM